MDYIKYHGDWLKAFQPNTLISKIKWFFLKRKIYKKTNWFIDKLNKELVETFGNKFIFELYRLPKFNTFYHEQLLEISKFYSYVFYISFIDKFGVLQNTNFKINADDCLKLDDLIFKSKDKNNIKTYNENNRQYNKFHFDKTKVPSVVDRKVDKDKYEYIKNDLFSYLKEFIPKDSILKMTVTDKNTIDEQLKTLLSKVKKEGTTNNE